MRAGLPDTAAAFTACNPGHSRSRLAANPASRAAEHATPAVTRRASGSDASCGQLLHGAQVLAAQANTLHRHPIGAILLDEVMLHSSRTRGAEDAAVWNDPRFPTRLRSQGSSQQTVYSVGMADSIPAEARERAEAILANLDAALAPVFAELPEGSNSAVVFQMPEEA